MTSSHDVPADLGGVGSPLSVLDSSPRSHPLGVGHASGKAILFGEHAVVYNRPAIAIPVRSLTVTAEAERVREASVLHSSLYTGPILTAPGRLLPTATALAATLEAFDATGTGIDVRVRSAIPAERGVGSSAAVAAAVVSAVAGALGVELDADARHELIQTAERAAHGSPSGLDARAVVADGPVWFQQGAVADLDVAAPLTLVIADSGVKGRTREAVAAVREHREADPVAVDAIIDALGALSLLGRDALAEADAEALGEAMCDAHTLLGRLGVGDPALDRLANAAMRVGALGAKLTGGGRGGCVLLLARDPDHAAVLAATVREAGAAAVWVTEVESTR
jgi:mevalonate kinase